MTSLSNYFAPYEKEESARIKVIQKGKELTYDEVSRLTVAKLACCEIELFGKNMVIAPHADKFEPVWSYEFTVMKSFTGDSPANSLLSSVYETAQQLGGFNQKFKFNGNFTRSSASDHRNQPQ